MFSSLWNGFNWSFHLWFSFLKWFSLGQIQVCLTKISNNLHHLSALLVKNYLYTLPFHLASLILQFILLNSSQFGLVKTVHLFGLKYHCWRFGSPNVSKMIRFKFLFQIFFPINCFLPILLHSNNKLKEYFHGLSSWNNKFDRQAPPRSIYKFQCIYCVNVFFMVECDLVHGVIIHGL